MSEHLKTAPGDSEREPQKQDTECAAALRKLSRRWQEKSQERADALSSELLKDGGQRAPDEALLLSLAAREAALHERLYELQVQLLERAHLLVDRPSDALTLMKPLREANVVAGAIGARVANLLESAAVLRAQRQLAGGKRGHLRVA